VLSFINQDSSTKIISSPRTVTLDNETASIEVGTMFPIVNTTASTVQVAGGSQISYSNLTVRLEVTPRVSANNFIHLHVLPKVLRLGDLVTTVVGGVNNSVFQFEKREVNTSVLIPSGNTLVMGGLVADNVHKESTKVPVLGDMPFLGAAFRSSNKTRTKSNLLIFITPTIVEGDDFQPTTSDFLKTPAPPADTVAPDWSPWDTTKPYDWSKPIVEKDASKSQTDWNK
jgi:general secretion pathway protein D